MKRGPSMSEFGGQSSGNPVTAQEESLQNGAGSLAEPGVSAGTLLRQAREAAGLHIAALAVALKVPVKKLEALEADRLDLLPDAVFARALAASVCRTLKIDSVQVLALLPQTRKPRLGHQRISINTPFRSPGDRLGPSLWAQISRPAVLAGLLLLLGALVLIFLPAVQQQNTVTQPVAGSVAAGSGSTQAQSVPSAQAGVALTSTELLSSAKPAILGGPVEQVVPAANLPVAPVLAPNLSFPPALPATGASLNPPAAVPAALAQPAPTGLIVFKAKGASWVEVTDAKGSVVLRRTLAPGETVGASGALPLAAVVGRVDATQVEVRGQTFDLSAVSKDNVARFEVK